MNVKSLQQSIANTVKKQGERLKGATPTLVAVALASGALIPLIQGDSNAALTLLSELGIATFSEFISDFLEKMREKYGKKKRKDEELQKELEAELLSIWEGGGEAAETLRRGISILLKSVHGVEKALAASSKELNEVLTQKFAALGGEFQEFRWVLDEIKNALADIQRRQTVQLATQKEQLELQREQLTKTNLLLKMQREGEKRPTPVGEVGAGEPLPPADIPCPYKGLAAFQPQDAQDFFGREELVAELLTRLTGTNFLGVVGPSGSGKSSVVRAGLIPSIWKGEIPGSDTWKTVIMTPGEKPLEELAVRIALQCGISAGSLMDDLKKDSANLRLGVKQVLAEEPEDARLVMVVDQFEEVFTLCQDSEEREAYITALMGAIREKDSQAIVILAMRADFYGRCAAYPALASLMADNQVLVGAMSAEELRRAITLPAQRVGLYLEAGLVEMVLREVEGEPGALPMLSHALMETWQRRSGNQLTVQGYLDSGGVSGAIAKTAESVYQGLTDEQKAIARNLFLRLTEIGEGIEATSRRTEFSELMSGTGQDAQINQVLQVLSDARLVITREEVAEVAHEALFDEWPTLRSWLEEDQEGLRIHHQLTQSARQWEDLDKDSSILYRGARLEQTSQWSKEHGEEMNRLEEEFLKASRTLRKRNRTLTIASLALVFTMLSFASVLFNRQAVENENIANTAQAEAYARATSQAEAESAKLEAENLARKNYSDSLAFQSQLLFSSNYDLSVLLAIESVEISLADTGVISKASNLALVNAYYNTPLITTYREHTDWIRSVSFSPDGQYILSASHDGTAKVWDKTGNTIATLKGHTGSIATSCFSSSGQYIVTASLDGTARLWNLSGDTVAILDHGSDVYSAKFSPDGHFIVTASWGSAARVWDLKGNLLLTLNGHSAGIKDATFSPDGQVIATASYDRTARLWDLAGNTIAILAGHTDTVSSVEFSPDGQFLVTHSGQKKGFVWDINGNLIATLEGHTGAITSASYSPDGKYILTASQDGTARLWNNFGNVQTILRGHTSGVVSADFSQDGQYIVTASWDNTARVWDLEGNQIKILIGHNYLLSSAAFSPDSRFIVSADHDGVARVWDLHRNQIAKLEGHTDDVYAIYSPDGQKILTGSDDNTARLWDLEGNTISILKGHTDIITSIAFSPDGKYILTTSYDKTARLWDLEDNTIITRYGEEGIDYAYFSPDGKYIATLSGWDYWSPRVWDINLNLVSILEGHKHGIQGLAFSPDGQLIVTASYDGTARLWDISGNTLAVLEGHSDDVHSPSFSPDGTLILTASRDGTARIWDLTGKTIEILRGHSLSVNSAMFSRDGKYILTGSDDGTARLWDLKGNTLAVLEGHSGSVYSLGFSPDGKYILTGSSDGIARLWDLSGNVIAIFRSNISELNSAVFSPDGQHVLTAHGDGNAYIWEFTTDIQEIISNLKNRINRDFSIDECTQYNIKDCP